MVVAADEPQHLGDVGGVGSARDQRRTEVAQEHQGAGPVAVVGLVAHLEHLAQDRGDVDRSGLVGGRPDGALQQGPEHVAHPAQPGQDVGGVGAVAQHLAEPLVERAVGACSGGGVLEHEHPHARRHDPGHRPDGAVVVAGLEADGSAAREEGGGVLRVVDQTLERGTAHERPAERPGGALPGDRWSGVQELAGLEPERLARRYDVHEARLHREHPLQRQRVRRRTCRVERHRGQVVLGAGHRRAPVDPRDVDGLAGDGLGEQVDADADTTLIRCLRAGRGRGGWRRRWTGGPRHPPRPGRRPAGRGPAGRARCRPRRRPPAGRRPARAGASVAAGSSSAPWPSTTSSRSTPVAGSAATSASRSRRRLGSIIGWARPSVYSSSPKSTRRRRRRRPRRTSTAASSLSVPPTNSPCSRVPLAGSARPDTGHSGTAWPSLRSTASAAAVRSGRPGPSSAVRTGVPSPSAYAVSEAATSSAGGLETSTTSSTAGSASRRASAVRGGEPADLGGQVAAADAVRRGDADAGMVEQSQHLLAAGARGRDDADRSGGDDVGEAEPDPVDDRGAAVGTHHEQAALGGVGLERDLLLDRHVVAEDHHVAAGLERVDRPRPRRSGRAPRPGPPRPGRAAGPSAVVRGGASSVGPATGAAAVGEGAVDLGADALEAVGVVEPDGDHEVVDRGVVGDREAHPRQHLDVERRRHRDLRGHHAGQLLHLAAHLEQGHRVGVGAGPELDVVAAHAGAHAARSAVSSARARSMPWARPRPELWPNDSRAARAASVARRTERAEVRATGSATSPARAQSSRVADRRGRARQEPAYGGVDVGRRHAGGAVGRQPAADHVVAERRQPVAATDQTARRSARRPRARRRRARPRGTGGIPLRRPGSPSEPVPHRSVAREHPRADGSPECVRPSEGSHLQHKPFRGPMTTPGPRLLRTDVGSRGAAWTHAGRRTDRPTSRWTRVGARVQHPDRPVGRGPQPRRHPRRGRHGEGAAGAAPGCSRRPR